MTRPLLLLLFAPLAWPQDCRPDLANRQLNQAQRDASDGNRDAALRVANSVAVSCTQFPAIIEKVAALYDALNLPAQAQRYRSLIGLVASPAPTPAVSALPPSTSPDSPTSPAELAQQVVDISPYVTNKYALVIGIGAFQNPNIPALQFAAKDARDISALLKAPDIGRFPDSDAFVKVLIDADATLVNIRDAIDQIARDSRPEDLVVIYVSTHGTSADMDSVDEAGRFGFIVAHDTDPSRLYATALPMSDLLTAVRLRIRAKRVVAFMDTCYSGEVRRNPSGGKSAFSNGHIASSAFSELVAGSKALRVNASSSRPGRAIPQGVGRVVITSSQPNEQSWESPTLDSGAGNSYFTFFLKQALRAGPDDNPPNIQQVFNHLKSTVPSAVRSEKKASQNPMIVADGPIPSIVIGTPTQ